MDEPRLGPSHARVTFEKGLKPLPPRPTKSILKRQIDQIYEMKDHVDGRLEEIQQYLWEEANAPSKEEEKVEEGEGHEKSVYMSAPPPSIKGVNVDYDLIVRRVREEIERERAKEEPSEDALYKLSSTMPNNYSSR